MSISTLFFVVSVIGLLFTLNALRPFPFEPLSVVAFFAGWLTSELPIHHLFWQAVATAAFIAAGALESALGWAGLAVTLVSWVGLLLLIRQANRAEQVIEDALVASLGPDYRDRMAPGLTDEQGVRKSWRRLILPFRFTDPDVEKVKDIQYVDDGRKAHRLDVYRPKDHRTGCPVLVYVHGGGWVIGDKREQGMPMMLHLAAHGWVCFTINYRLSPKHAWPAHLDDVHAALRWVEEHAEDYGGDASYIVISGGSAGGHLSALGALTASDDGRGGVDAAVPIYGVYDFTNRDGLRDHRFISLFLERMIMKTPFETNRKAYEDASPIDRVHADAPPFLVIHGANDSLVPVAEARSFVRTLEAAGVPVTYAELPGAQHAFEVFRSIRTAHVVDGIARWLAVRYAEARRSADA
jgi:acetyl esterase/lipase